MAELLVCVRLVMVLLCVAPTRLMEIRGVRCTRAPHCECVHRGHSVRVCGPHGLVQ